MRISDYLGKHLIKRKNKPELNMPIKKGATLQSSVNPSPNFKI